MTNLAPRLRAGALNPAAILGAVSAVALIALAVVVGGDEEWLFAGLGIALLIRSAADAFGVRHGTGILLMVAYLGVAVISLAVYLLR